MGVTLEVALSALRAAVTDREIRGSMAHGATRRLRGSQTETEALLR